MLSDVIFTMMLFLIIRYILKGIVKSSMTLKSVGIGFHSKRHRKRMLENIFAMGLTFAVVGVGFMYAIIAKFIIFK